jgi:hypothetical protein
MSNSNGVDGHGALVLMPELPLRGRFTMLISDSFCFEVTETQTGVRLDFRPRTLRERVEVWRRKLGL